MRADQCTVANQFCNALGAVDGQQGTCVEAKPAGAACTPAVAAASSPKQVAAAAGGESIIAASLFHNVAILTDLTLCRLLCSNWHHVS